MRTLSGLPFSHQGQDGATAPAAWEGERTPVARIRCASFPDMRGDVVER